MKSICLPSFAKLNFGLAIKGERGDGYHEIETFLQQIDLKDRIELTYQAAPQITLECDSPDIPAGEANICFKAAALLQKAKGTNKGVQIKLSKIIPVGAGLGGGSSNAAVVLLGLNRLWDLGLAAEELENLASELGSDVPFFIQGGTALAQGRGEILSPVPTSMNWPVLLVYPGCKISTEWAYQQVNLSLTIKKKNSKLAHFKDRNFNDVDLYPALVNEFEEVVFRKYEILRQIKQTIYERNPLFVSMSGSGSTIFGVFQDEREVRKVASLFTAPHATFLTRPVSWGYRQLFCSANSAWQQS